MKFANAYKGLKLINIAEMLNIGSMIMYIVSMVMLIAMSGGNMSSMAAQIIYESGGGNVIDLLNIVYLIMQALGILSDIMLVVGINKAKTDDKKFDSAFSFACIGLVMIIINFFVRGWFGVLLATALGIIFLFFRLRVIGAVENIAHELENADMSGKAKIFSVILIILMIITAIITVINQAVPAVSLLVGIIGNSFGIVKSMVFIAYLTKALKMLKA